MTTYDIVRTCTLIDVPKSYTACVAWLTALLLIISHYVTMNYFVDLFCLCGGSQYTYSLLVGHFMLQLLVLRCLIHYH
jgi:hypothetical protein